MCPETLDRETVAAVMRAHTAPGRAAYFRTFLTQVDPEGRLDPDERERLARAARRDHMRGLAKLSNAVQAQRRKEAADVA
jgi:hypothetical protein